MDADGTSRDRCRFRDLCIDVTDQHRLAPFWAAALGLEAEALDNGGYRLGDIAGLLGSGATLLRSRGDDLVRDVLADPEGNEFCVFPAQ